MADPAQILDQIEKFAVLSVIIIPAVVGLTEVAKRSGVPAKFAALVALVFGIAASFLLLGVSALTTFMGVIYGLSASGLYSGTKAMAPKTGTPPPSPVNGEDQLPDHSAPPTV